MYQRLTVVGNVGSAPETREWNGQTVTNFSVASNRRWKNAQGEQQEEVTWLRVTAWGKLGDVCAQYVHKGMKVLVEGELKPDPATGGPRVFLRQDGTAGASFEVTARDVRFLSSASEADAVREEGAPAAQPKPAAQPTFAKVTAGVGMRIEEDDVPF